MEWFQSEWQLLSRHLMVAGVLSPTARRPNLAAHYPTRPGGINWARVAGSATQDVPDPAAAEFNGAVMAFWEDHVPVPGEALATLITDFVDGAFELSVATFLTNANALCSLPQNLYLIDPAMAWCFCYEKSNIVHFGVSSKTGSGTRRHRRE